MHRGQFVYIDTITEDKLFKRSNIFTEDNITTEVTIFTEVNILI